MTFAGLLILASSLFLMTLAIGPWVRNRTRGGGLQMFGALRYPNFR